ncbi:MAG: glycosyltransferase family 2 protein [Thermodesulfobacteriota bacterium]
MVFVILPAYNEEEKIGGLIRDIDSTFKKNGTEYRTIVVNDGSSDGTAGIVRGLSKTLPVTLIDLGTNKGVHEAFRRGFNAVYGLSAPGDIILTMDSDGTHDVKKSPEMIERIRSGCDIVIASRFRRGSRIYGVPLYRNFLSYAARYVVPFVFGEREARDFTIFHRAYRAEILKGLIDHYGERFIESTGFTANTEVLVKARIYYGKRLKVCEVPCELHYELKAGPSKMNVWSNLKEYFTFIWRMKFKR